MTSPAPTATATIEGSTSKLARNAVWIKAGGASASSSSTSCTSSTVVVLWYVCQRAR
jgi:hypothetical protein